MNHPGRARVLGRVVLFWAFYLAILFGTGMLKSMAPAPARELVWGAASVAAVFALTLLFLRRECRGLDSVGMQFGSGSVPRLGLGMLIGFAIYGLQLLAVIALGGVRLERGPGVGSGAILLAACTYLALSGMEELGYRGYPLRSLVPAFGFWRGQLIVALAFALNHLLFGWSWQAALIGVVTGGLLFGMAALASGGLAVPIGLHAAWNSATWAAGEKGSPGLWRAVVADGGEGRANAVASVSYVVVMLLATSLFWLWYRNRNAAVT